MNFFQFDKKQNNIPLIYVLNYIILKLWKNLKFLKSLLLLQKWMPVLTFGVHAVKVPINRIATVLTTVPHSHLFVLLSKRKKKWPGAPASIPKISHFVTAHTRIYNPIKVPYVFHITKNKLLIINNIPNHTMIGCKDMSFCIFVIFLG